jgi:flagellar biosynthesis protein
MVDFLDTDEEKKAAEENRRLAAVALKRYGIDENALPKVIASGYGKLAEEILEIAFRNGVKVREDKDLAQLLAALDQGRFIPPEALMAVAEVLAYVYKANGTYQSTDRPTQKER